MRTTTATAARVTIEKVWDENVRETERNGRIYVSNGRWQWLLVVDGETIDAFDSRGEAREYAASLEGAQS